MTDRLPAGYFEADDEGYMQTGDNPGPDGMATGIEVGLYVDAPSQMIDHMYGTDFTFTEEELDDWPSWIRAEYAADDWNFDADHLVQGTAVFCADYLPSESTDNLYMRLTVNNRRYNRIRNECNIYYTSMHKYIDHCKAQRQSDRRP